jgi:hypothetical protein
MARVKYGAIVTDIRGSIGGTTFQGNAYGSTVKNKSLQVRPNTAFQNKVKSIFSASVKAWRSFSDTERNNWNTYAANFPQYTKNDPTVALSGFNAFVKWQSAYYLSYGITLAPEGSPLTSLPATDAATPSVTLSGGILRIVPGWAGATGVWNVNWFISSPKLSSQLFFGSNRRWIVYSLNTNTPIIITDAYIAQFGTLPAIGDAVNLSSVLFVVGGGEVQAAVNYRIIVS